MKTIYPFLLLVFFYSCYTESKKESKNLSKEYIFFTSVDMNTKSDELRYYDVSDNKTYTCSGLDSINFFAVADDSSCIVYNRYQKGAKGMELFLFNIKTGSEKLIDTLGYIVHISPDNKWITYRTNHDLIISDTSGKNKQILLKGSESPENRIYYKSPVWSNDGEFIYYSLINKASDSVKISLQRISVKTKLVEDIAINADGPFLKIARNTKDEIYAYEQPNNGKRFEENIVRFRKNQSGKWEKEIILTDGSDVFDVSPDGKNLVFMKDSIIQDTIRYAWHLFIYDIDKKKTKQITFGSQSCDWPVWKKFN